jgi:glycolate oxidase iron-sulfur subunit
MRQVMDGALELDASVKGHLDLCLDCRACETACPSGVQYGRLIEPFRTFMAGKEPGRQLESLSAIQRWMLLHIFPSRLRTRLALAPARFAQWTGLDWLAGKIGVDTLLPEKLRDMKRMLPPLEPHYGTLPLVLPAEGKTRARVALFLGCVADALYPQTNLHTARVLQKNGCEVWIPRTQGCCGALHHHAAMEEEAVALADRNLDVFATLPNGWEKLDAIVNNAAGCGAMLKEYPHLGANPAYGEFAKKVKDVSEFLYYLGPVKPKHALNVRATYHDACHLRHAQQIHKQPRALLEMIPGLELIPLAESELCCGAAGSYNLTQPAMAGLLGDRKAENIRATGARALFAGNVGCLMQIARHMKAAAPDVWCAHPIDALYASYTGEMPKELNAGRV